MSGPQPDKSPLLPLLPLLHSFPPIADSYRVHPIEPRTFINRPLQASDQTPIARPSLPPILHRIPLNPSPLRPERKVEQIHGKDEIQGPLPISRFGVEVMSGPGLRGILFVLHEGVDGGCGEFGAGRVDGDVDGVVVDVLGGEKDARSRGQRCGRTVHAGGLSEEGERRWIWLFIVGHDFLGKLEDSGSSRR